MSYLVTETTLTPAGHEIAPDEDPEGEIVFQELLQSLQEEDEGDDEHETTEEIAA